MPSDQIGCIIGKGGHIIQGIRSETGAQIRVLSNDHIPACAINGDELLQVGGPRQFLHYLNKWYYIGMSVYKFTFCVILVVYVALLNVCSI